jgi:hypothetical protein
MVTPNPEVNVPGAGLNVGTGRGGAIVYNAVAVLLFVYPFLTAIASSVSVEPIEIAPEYMVEDVVGDVPLVV